MKWINKLWLIYDVKKLWKVFAHIIDNVYLFYIVHYSNQTHLEPVAFCWLSTVNLCWLQVVDMMAGAISDLMEAEFTGFTDRRGACVLPDMASLADWKQQVYLQSGSLLANSCKAAVKLGGHGDDTQEDAFHFGSNTACVQQVSLVVDRCWWRWTVLVEVDRRICHTTCTA